MVGQKKNTLDTILGLNEMGHEVHLIYGGQSDPNALMWKKFPSDVKTIVVPELVREVEPLKDLIANGKIRRVIAEEGYDKVNTHLAKASVLGRIAAKKERVGLVMHGLHGTTFPDSINKLKRLFFREIEKYYAKYTDKFISVGNDIKDKYLKAGIGKRDQYHVVRSGIVFKGTETAIRLSDGNRERLKRSLGIESEDVVVGMVAKLEERKAYKYFIEAAAELVRHKNNLKFLIVGHGDEKERLKIMVKDKHLEDHIIITGYRTDVAKVISIFDIAVLTSLWEGLPEVLVQAATLSKPVVTFDVDDAREVVHDSLNVVILSIKDVEELVTKIRLLLDDEVLKSRMGIASEDIVDRSCSVENMVKRTWQVYETAV